MARRGRSDRARAFARGALGEALCRWALRLKGYRILASRYDRGGVGEVDILARRGRLLAVVEVKAHVDREAGRLAVTPRQRRRIERGVGAFLASRPDCADLEIRFDVMTLGRFLLPRHETDAWRPDRS